MIALIRHGEPAAGWGDAADPGLSDLGRRQAEAVAQAVSALGFSGVVTSPMQRCRETAAPFAAALSVSPEVLEAVSEVGTPEAVADRVAWLRGVMAGTWADAGAELAGWRHAAVEAVSALPDGTAVFSHFVAINAIVGALEGVDDVIVFRPGHCSLTRLGRTGAGLTVIERGSEAATRVL